MSKKRYIKVSLSTPFPLKNRCKYCSSTPEYYYYTRNSASFQDHEVSQFINMWIVSNHKRMCQDFYLTEMPKSFNKTGFFAHLVDYKSFNPRFHKNGKDDKRSYNPDLTTIDHVSCHCGKTSWAFNATASKGKREVSQRKARVAVPKRFDH